MTTAANDPLSIIARHQSSMPVRVFDLVRDLGMDFERRPMADHISGAIERAGSDRYRVVVNSNQSATRQRFTAGHEIGHFIYHRDLLGQGVGDTLAYRADGSDCPNPAIRPVHERQANSFAANLLMPRDWVVRYKDMGVTDPEQLALNFGVSEQAMRIRLGLPRD